MMKVVILVLAALACQGSPIPSKLDQLSEDALELELGGERRDLESEGLQCMGLPYWQLYCRGVGGPIKSIPAGLGGDVRVLYLANVASLGNSSTVVYENITTLVISDCYKRAGLDEIDGRHLRRNFPNLQDLIVNCKLRSLDLAGSYPSLTGVYVKSGKRLRHRLLKKIDLKGLRNLKNFGLEGCKPQEAHRDWDMHVEQLESLHLKDCPLRNLPEISPFLFPKLKELQLDQLKFAFGPREVINAPQLERVELEDMDMSRVNLATLLSRASHLTKLAVEDTNLGSFPETGLHLDGLKSLKLEDNHLEELDLSSYNLTNVEEIELEDEPLTMLRLPIESMQKLSKLEIEDSKLKSFSLGPNKIDLEELDIKKNKKLESLELGALTQIKKLQIRRNPKLKSIRFNSGAPFVSEKIELEGSPNLECSCDLVDLLSIADLAVVKVEGACLSKDGGKLDLKKVTRQNCVA